MNASVRTIIAYTTIAVFFLYFISSSIIHKTTSVLDSDSEEFFTNKKEFPDFSQYIALATLSQDQFPIDDANKRVIVVGDIHGMNEAFQSLLLKISYDPKSDILVHVGDIIAKGPHTGSMSVISTMASHNITGVRGNHDQQVIEWRSWIDWVSGIPGGMIWLEEIDDKWAESEEDGKELDSWLASQSEDDWWKKIPNGWVLFSDHYKIARSLSEGEYQYLLSLPLTLYVPSAHTYIVHAGLLPSDPKYEPHHLKQPLAHVPAFPSGSVEDVTSNSAVSMLRRLQELALLNEVPQNKVPWVVLNMRGVLKNQEVTRKQRGKPWSELWNRDMDLCDGFDLEKLHLSTHKHKKDPLPCHPATVIYGHAAARNLDVKRWTVGLDSGCVYGRRLTALVLGGASRRKLDGEDVDSSNADLNNEKLYSVIPFSDDGEGRIVSVKC